MPLFSPTYFYIHTKRIPYSLCSQRERNSISVQSHLQVHRWCIVQKQPRIRKLSRPVVSCWTWDQGHHREYHSCFLPRFTTVDWEGWSTSHFHLRQTRWYQFYITNFLFLSSNIPSSPAYGVLFLNLYDSPGLATRMNVSFRGPGDFPVSYSKRDTSWSAWNRHSGSFMVDTGTLFSNMKSPSRECWMTFWPLTNSDFPTDQTFHQFNDLYIEFDLHQIMSSFHGAFATGVACQQGTSTLPDTWFRHRFLDLLVLQFLRPWPDSSNLPCLYSTFHLEYPLVLSRFCFPL